jgi:peptide chain release factor
VTQRWLLTVSSGLGPVEVRVFVGMLANRLAQELPERGACVESVFVHGSEAQPSSVDIALLADRSAIVDLLGTHALIQQSPHRGKRSRKRWYAAVSSIEIAQTAAAIFDAREVVFETCRASGTGGQHVNKTESAVRALHLPTGLRVRIESERSQQQNKRRALEALAEALAQQRDTQRADAKSQRRYRSLQVERGRPVATWRCEGETLVRVDADA